MRYLRPLLAGLAAALFLTCTPPPRPDLPGEEDFTMTVTPVQADSLETGDTINLKLALCPSWYVDTINVSIGAPCANAATLDTATDLRYLRDTVELALALPCTGDVWIRVRVHMEGGTVALDSVQVNVKDTSDTSQGSALARPAHLAATRTDTAHTLVQWSPVSGAVVYLVYSNSNRDFGYSLAGQSVDTFFTHATKFDYWYYVVAQNIDGQKAYSRDTVKTTPLAAPVIVNQPGNEAYVVGDSIRFSVQAMGARPFAYAWSKDGRALSGGDSTYFMGSAVLADSGRYSCRITDKNGLAASCSTWSLTITTQAASPQIEAGPVDQRVTEMDTARFGVTAQGTTLRYQWYKNGVLIPQATSQTYIIDTVLLSDAGLYSVKVYNSVGADSSTSARLTVDTLKYKVVIECGAHGSVQPRPANDTLLVRRDSSVTLRFLPDSTYHVDTVYIDEMRDTVAEEAGMVELRGLAANHLVRVVFAINAYTLSVTASTGGSVAQDPSGRQTFNQGEAVVLTAQAEPDYYFAGWSGDTSGSASPLTLAMTAPKGIKGNFFQKPTVRIIAPTANDTAVVRDSVTAVSGTATSQAALTGLAATINGGASTVAGLNTWADTVALRPFQWNTYKITATDSCGKTALDSVRLFYQPRLAPPAAPRCDTTVSTNTSLKIVWDTVKYCTNYLVYRSATDSAGPYSLVSSALDTTVFTDTALQVGGTYWYKVRGFYSRTTPFALRDTTQHSPALRARTVPWFQKVCYLGAYRNLRVTGRNLFYGVQRNTQFVIMGEYVISDVSPFLVMVNDRGDTSWTENVAMGHPFARPVALGRSNGSGPIVCCMGGETGTSILLRETDSLRTVTGTGVYDPALYTDVRCIVATRDNQYLLAGYNGSLVSLLKLDRSGQVLWDTTYDSASVGKGSVVALVTAPDSGYVFVANVQSGGGNIAVVKVNETGGILWRREHGNIGVNEVATYAVPASDGGYAICGSSTESASTKGLILKLNAIGNASWGGIRTYGGTQSVVANCIIETADRGYAFAGYTQSGTSGMDVVALKVDALGNQVWMESYGGSSRDEGLLCGEMPDKGLYILGATQSYGSSDRLYMIRTDENGKSPIPPQ